MSYKILFHPLAQKELLELDNSIRILVLKQIKKISEAPLLGEELGNKSGMNLSGYRKMYAAKKSVRIVYTIKNDIVAVKIIALGKRSDFEVYKAASERIKQKKPGYPSHDNH